MTQETDCNAPDCDEALTVDKYGRGEGILRGGGLYCDMNCYQSRQRAEIDRICEEMRTDI